MFDQLKRFIKYTTPLLFSKETVPNIIAESFFAGLNIASDFLSAYVFSLMIESLTEEKPQELLGISLSPLALVALYPGLMVSKEVINMAIQRVHAPIDSSAVSKLLLQYTDTLMNQPLDFHLKTSSGEHDLRISKCFSSIYAVSSQLSTSIIPTTIEAGISIGLLSKLYGPKMAISLLAILISYGIYNVATKDIVSDKQTKCMTENIRTYEALIKIIRNFETIHMFGTLNKELDMLSADICRWGKIQVEVTNSSANVSFFRNLIINGGFAGLTIFAGYKTLQHQYGVKDFILMSSYLLQLSGPLKIFGQSMNQLMISAGELDIVYQDFEKTKIQRHDEENSPLDLANYAASYPVDIEFRNVSFKYPEKEELALDNLSFTIKAGQKVGITGPSGSGKSTICRLMFRFYELEGLSSGEILINGQEIRQFSKDSLRAIVGIVPQYSILFNDTLGYNIAYGGLSRDVPVSDEEIEVVVERSCLSDYVSQQEKGLSTMVGENGAEISGGQRQRVSIARVILKKPKIFMFDEPTSSLDNATEVEVSTNIDDVTKGITTLIVSHRLWTIRNADHILVLNLGTLVEEGTHEELLKRDGLYAQLWQEQRNQYLDQKQEIDTTITMDEESDESLLQQNEVDDCQIQIESFEEESAPLLNFGNKPLIFSPGPNDISIVKEKIQKSCKIRDSDNGVYSDMKRDKFLGGSSFG